MLTQSLAPCCRRDGLMIDHILFWCTHLAELVQYTVWQMKMVLLLHHNTDGKGKTSLLYVG